MCREIGIEVAVQRVPANRRMSDVLVLCNMSMTFYPASTTPQILGWMVSPLNVQFGLVDAGSAKMQSVVESPLGAAMTVTPLL